MTAAEPKNDVTVWIRKRGRSVHLGHRDFARTVDRGLRRSGLPFRLTEGFHPHPKMVLPEPLPLGVGSEGEPFVLRFAEPVAEQAVADALGAQLRSDVAVIEVRAGDHREPVDLPLHLRLDGDEPEPLRRGITVLEAGELGLRDLRLLDRQGIEVELVPRERSRASIGRFLRALRAELGEECAIRSVTRLRACTGDDRH